MLILSICLKLIRGMRKPIVSTSANISGEKSPTCFDDVSDIVKENVDTIVEANLHREMNQPSQIIKVGLNGSVELIRK